MLLTTGYPVSHSVTITKVDSQVVSSQSHKILAVKENLEDHLIQLLYQAEQLKSRWEDNLFQSMQGVGGTSRTRLESFLSQSRAFSEF
jgi:hypothetical protein